MKVFFIVVVLALTSASLVKAEGRRGPIWRRGTDGWFHTSVNGYYGTWAPGYTASWVAIPQGPTYDTVVPNTDYVEGAPYLEPLPAPGAPWPSEYDSDDPDSRAIGSGPYGGNPFTRPVAPHYVAPLPPYAM